VTIEKPTGGTTDPQTARRVRTHEKFEKSMEEHGLLEENGSVGLEPDQIEHETPPGTEQTAG
jgi:hypothetical protein